MLLPYSSDNNISNQFSSTQAMSTFISRLVFMTWLIVKQCLCVPYDGARTYLTPLVRISEGWSSKLANSWQPVYDPGIHGIKVSHLKETQLICKELRVSEEFSASLIIDHSLVISKQGQPHQVDPALCAFETFGCLKTRLFFHPWRFKSESLPQHSWWRDSILTRGGTSTLPMIPTWMNLQFMRRPTMTTGQCDPPWSAPSVMTLWTACPTLTSTAMQAAWVATELCDRPCRSSMMCFRRWVNVDVWDV